MQSTDLKTLATGALTRGRDLQGQRQQVQADATANAQTDLELAAELVLVQVQVRILMAARDGVDYAQIMKIGHDDHNGHAFRGGIYNKLSPEHLRGVAQIVYNQCLEAGLQPKIQGFHHDGENIDQHIVVPLGYGNKNRYRFD